jgi:4-oxalocrotonate tautomerase
MPIVTIDLIEGSTLAQKKALAAKITTAVCDAVEVPPSQVRVKINDMKKSDFAVAGVLVSDR